MSAQKVPSKLSVNGCYVLLIQLLTIFLNFITRNIISLGTVLGGWEIIQMTIATFASQIPSLTSEYAVLGLWEPRGPGSVELT